MTNPTIGIVFTGEDCFVTIEGLRIAKRRNGEWVSLESGWSVSSPPDHSTISVQYNGETVH